MPTIAILGAHTAAAKALVECLDERDITVGLSLLTTSDHLDDGLDLISEDALRSADLIVLAFKGKEARGVAEAARKLGKPVLDLSEELADDKRARFIFPGIDRDAGASFDPAIFSLLPLGLAAPIVAVLRAFAAFEPMRATIATYESTAAAGDQPGMDELSEQIRARFSMREPEPSVFRASIAFGTIPAVGDDPFAADELLRRAIESGTEESIPDLDLSVTRVLVPTFSADSAVVIIDVAKTPDKAAAGAALKGARGIHYLGDELPSSIDAIGRDDVLAGRVAIEDGRIALWIASDRLRRGSATLAALAIERWLNR